MTESFVLLRAWVYSSPSLLTLLPASERGDLAVTLSSFYPVSIYIVLTHLTLEMIKWHDKVRVFKEEVSGNLNNELYGLNHNPYASTVSFSSFLIWAPKHNISNKQSLPNNSFKQHLFNTCYMAMLQLWNSIRRQIVNK